uniref:zona pellucida sperm-binding protein 3 n=1 Tax=Scatophagus argus TaxID=75038 RepID=UPI001ED7D416|nr:zona pellucida sperm-binding protein 3 [Scatophagus argus]
MKTKWHLYIMWSVLSLGLLNSAVRTYESQFTRRKKVFKLGTPKTKPIKLSSTGDRQSTKGLPGSTSSLSQLSSRRPYPPSVRGTPRSGRPQEPRTMIQSDFAYVPDVSVTCSTSDFVVRVKPAFYGLGADAEELKLGNTCKSNGVLRPYDDLLFTYPLTACDAVRQSPRGYLVYKFVLHYVPSPKRFPSRAHRIDVNIECRYPRNHYVYQLTVQPTWKTAVVRKRLKGSPNDFQIELMDESWSRPARSQVYQLGKTVNFQVSAPHLPVGGKLYINSCYATPSSGSKSSLKYIIIDNFGCMLDSKRDPGASQFISRTDRTVRFSLKAFQFISDPDTEVNVHCKLFVTSEDLGPAHKSCTFKGNRWKALTGDDSICACCDSRCVSSKPRRAMMEGSASSGSLLVSDQPYTAEVGFLPISPSSVSMSREDKASISQYTDVLQSHENLWGSVDIIKHDDDDNDAEDEEELEEDEKESGVNLIVMTEPDLGELGFKERDLMEEKNESEVRESNQFEEDGSGYFVEEDFSESEEGLEGREDEISDVQQVIHLDQKEGEMLPSAASLQRALQPLVPEGEENWKHTGRGEEDERMIASEVEWKDEDKDLVNDREMTWYFTWR